LTLRALTLSTVGLVLATRCAVAWAAHALIPGLPWEVAFVLRAIVPPSDPLAAATIMRCLDTPRRLVSSIEGEGPSTTRPRSWPTASRSPPSWPGATPRRSTIGALTLL
jgi:NhaP-type Na+/H+ and K+/H+ antiporter